MTPLPLVTFLLLLNSVVNAWVVPSSPQKNSMTLFEKARHDQHTEFMEREPGSLVGDLPDLTDDLVLVRSIVKAGDGRKAEDIVGLQVAQVSTLTSYMVFLSGNSRPQNQAIAAAIADQVEEEFGIHKNPQGTADSGWMVLDYGSVMVHIMTPKSRLFYDVEGQVRVVRRLMIPDCIMFIVSHLFPFFLSAVARQRRNRDRSIRSTPPKQFRRIQCCSQYGGTVRRRRSVLELDTLMDYAKHQLD
jgi:ribosome-associated protein